jgi:nucleoside-diphosphate-sugar epimerase
MEPEAYATFPSFWSDPHARKWNLWGYVDSRDVAQACRLGLTAGTRGAEIYIIAAADTVMDRPSAALMREVFPTVPVRTGLGRFDTLLSVQKARAQLGYAPQHSWRQYVGPP